MILGVGFQPCPGGLPLFLLRLATEVNWNEEKACFRSISRELGLYYGSGINPETLQHAVFPALCQLLVPSKNETEDCIATLTTLGSLYKAFER
mmetsp:Transcript_14878/g.21464  ORF Transcript_14878/g.21464 Transcript_14878/m.21464 type:complete len:93 (+) Transcript_14878:607-885(+)